MLKLLLSPLPALALACASASGTYAPIGPEHPASAQAVELPIQDPSASLDPRMTVGSIVAEPLNIYGIGTREERRERVRELLRVVGLNAYFEVRNGVGVTGDVRWILDGTNIGKATGYSLGVVIRAPEH